MRSIGPFRLLWGKPRHDTRLRACTGFIRKGDGPWDACFAAHTVQRWYALAFRARWMIGFVRFGETQYGRNAGEPVLPSIDDTTKGGGDGAG